MKQTMIALAAGLGLTAGLGMTFAPPASAQRPDGESHATGDCSASSTWFLRAGRNQGGHGHMVVVRFRLHTATADEAWDWQVTDNGTLAASGQSSTDAHGVLDVRVKTPNQHGDDEIVMDAANSITAETCQGAVTAKRQQ